MPDLITIGESMLRFSTPVGRSLERATQFEVNVAGAESNVAVTASRMGLSAGWISGLPDNPLGRLVVNTLTSQGVDVSHVIWKEQGRIGTYYLELGSTPRGNRVIYDRAGSAVTNLKPDDIDWDYVATARVIHLTGITPALGPGCSMIIQKAIQVARDHAIMLSFDVNYRSKLWPPSDAEAMLTPMLYGIDILRAGSDEARALFGMEGDPGQIARELRERFEAQLTIVTSGPEPAVAFDGTKLYQHNSFPVSIVDEIGAGDAFMAGFLTAYLNPEGSIGTSVARGLEFGQALAALKLTYTGDIAWCTRAEVEALIANQSAGWR